MNFFEGIEVVFGTLQASAEVSLVRHYENRELCRLEPVIVHRIV